MERRRKKVRLSWLELEPRWLLNRSHLVAATLIELCNGNIFSLQVLTKNLERGRFTWTIQPGEVKECHKVTEGRCSNGDWRRFFEAAGEIFPFLKSSNFPENVPGVQIFSETWALPITVLVAVVAYAVLAAGFYNVDA